MIKSTKKIDVVLLCGGKGQRLRPYTLNTPKPLLLVNKKPFLYYMISKFLKLNVDQVILATGYKSHMVTKFVNKYFKKNKKIKLVDSGNVDIIKRLKDCSAHIRNDFFVCYGDTYIDINLKKYTNDFRKKNISASVVSAYYRLKYGTITYNKNNFLIKQFNEKPLVKNPINLGYFIFKKELILEINTSKSWINFLNKLIKNKRIFTNITNKKYFSFDSPREYNEINTKFKEMLLK